MMMMEYSFNNDEAYKLIEKAVKSVLKSGYRTQDIYTDDCVLVGTQQMGNLITQEILY